MAFRKKPAVETSPLAPILDALIPLTEEQFTSLFDAAHRARKLKAEMDDLRAGLG